MSPFDSGEQTADGIMGIDGWCDSKDANPSHWLIRICADDIVSATS
jgi:hypothetical protein